MSAAKLVKIFFCLIMPLIAVVMTILAIYFFNPIAEFEYKIGIVSFEKKDKNLGIVYLKKAANRGHSEAAYELAQLYQFGKYFPIDKKEAVFWYQKAVDLGHAYAMNDLAVLYSRGDGVEKNPHKVLELFKLAAAKGDSTAMYNVGLAYSHLDNLDKEYAVPVDYKQAAWWYDKSLKTKPDYCATNDLGILYTTGRGVEQNSKMAKDLFAQTFKLMLSQGEISKESTNERNDFIEYQYSLAANQEVDLILQNSSKKTAVKAISQKLVDTCWK